MHPTVGYDEIIRFILYDSFPAQKLVDAWQNTGPASLRLPNVKKSDKLPRDRCESILAYLLLEGYLKEDFHYTPYSTISYLLLGMSYWPFYHDLIYQSAHPCTGERALHAKDEILMRVEASSEANGEDKAAKGKAVRKKSKPSPVKKKPKVDECLIEVSDSD